jgi:hypothetical protein
MTFFLRTGCASGATGTGDMNREVVDSLLGSERLASVLQVSPILRGGGNPPLPGDKYAAINDLRGIGVCKNVITKGLSLNLGK